MPPDVVLALGLLIGFGLVVLILWIQSELDVRAIKKMTEEKYKDD